MLDEFPDEDELVLAEEEEPLLFPDAEEAGEAAGVDADGDGVDGALDEDSVVAVVGEGFDASPDGGFILSE